MKQRFNSNYIFVPCQSFCWMVSYNNIQNLHVIEAAPHQLHGETHQVLPHPLSHIVVSKKNQEEIFASLSKNDFKKIISNLDDENLSSPFTIT